MEKIINKLHNMSLKKSLSIILGFFLLIMVLVTFFTVYFMSEKREQIIMSRSIYIQVGDITSTPIEGGGYIVNTENYTYGELSSTNQFLYYLLGVLIILLPVIYLSVGIYLIVKIYYRLKLNKPIQELKKGMEYFTKDDFDFHIDYNSNDELGKLCNTFEIMKNELNENNKRMWEMIEDKKNLTASVSHDIRTPITVIKGYIDYLNNNYKSINKDELKQVVDSINISIERLNQYVESIQNIQKIDNIIINKENVDIKLFINELNASFKILCSSKDIDFKINYNNEDKTILIDKTIIFRILENIIDNALRHAKKEIALKIDINDKLTLILKDDGEGFKESVLNNKKFVYSSNEGIFGIGLSIVKVLTERHNGKLLMYNNNGACVEIIINL